MARQAGLLKITGTLDNLHFYRRGSEFFVKLRPHVDPKNLVKGPGYERQRGSMLEFGYAAKAGNLIYQAFAPSLQLAKDTNLNAHLLRVVHKVIKSDTTNERGNRNITDGDTSLMEGFEFNEKATLSKVLLSPYTATIDASTGSMSVTIHELNLNKMVKAPKPATHFMVQLTGAAIDFVDKQYISETISSAELPLKGVVPDPITLTVKLSRINFYPHFLALRVSFLQEHNGVIKPLSTIAYNAMAFVKVLCI